MPHFSTHLLKIPFHAKQPQRICAYKDRLLMHIETFTMLIGMLENASVIITMP